MKEQARSMEGRSRIPEEEQAIKTGNLAAPSLFMPLSLLFKEANRSPQIYSFLQEAYPVIVGWYDWYERKVGGKSIPCTFSYRERTSTLTEQSNLDDYPRAVNVHDRAEVHLDLQSQMIEFALVMEQYSILTQGPDSQLSTDFKERSICYAKKLQDYLLMQ